MKIFGQYKKIRKTWVPLIIGAFFLLGSVGLFFSMFSMDGQMQEMSSCSIQGHFESWCPMNNLDHFSFWKSVFSVTLPSLDFFSLFFSIIFVVFSRTIFKEIRNRISHDPPFIFLEREAIFLRIFFPLQLAFQTGILHPKKGV